MSMTHEEAARILDPKTSAKVLREYGDGNAQITACDEACRIAAKLLRKCNYNATEMRPDRKPLTMEQLREMDGKPVWIERNESPHDGKWFIVDHADIENPDRTLYTKEGVTYSDYGVHFTAYAYPPAHIDREEWVSVEERLPEDEKDGETVLVIVFGKPHENITLHGAIMTAGYFRDEGWVLNEYPEWEGPEVTHWMPLPSPPAELEKRLRGVRA